MPFPIEKTLSEWATILADKGAEPHALQITRMAATERPFTGLYNHHQQDGVYHCICCDQALFASTTKFDAGCGWPSYYQPIALRQSPCVKTLATACTALRCCAASAVPIWATCFPMVPHQQGSAIASTPPP